MNDIIRSGDPHKATYSMGLRPMSAYAASNVLDLLSSHQNYSIFLTVLMTAGLEDALMDAKELTLFAPDNSVFRRCLVNQHPPCSAGLTSDEALAFVEPYIIFGAWPIDGPSKQRHFVSCISGELRVLQTGPHPSYCGIKLAGSLRTRGVVLVGMTELL